MKKRIFTYFNMLISVACACFVASCSSSDDDVPGYNPEYGTGDIPEVVDVWPENGVTDIDTIDSIVVTYNMPIKVTPYNSVKITATDENGTSTFYADTAYVQDGNKMVALFNTIGNTDYTVKIMKPTVHNGKYAFARDYEFGFKIKVYNNFDPTPFADLQTELCNANATAKTKAVFAYLVENFGQNVLSATMSDPAWDNSMAEKMYELSGKYPAIHTYDFLHLRWSKPLSSSSWINYMDATPVEQWTAAGGLVGAGWHWSVPKTQADISNLNNYAFYAEDNEFNARNALKTSRWEHKQINEDLDALVTILKNLQDNDITVIFRPLHEASGGWFWWATSGAAQYKKLWQYVYNYLTDAGVNNLIWVWTSQGDDANWYPGDAYVDIVGCDVYDTESHASRIDKWQQLLDITGGKKIITMSECGGMPSIGNMLMSGDMWSWVMPWNGDFMTDTYNSASFLKTFMNSEKVISRDELPSFGE